MNWQMLQNSRKPGFQFLLIRSGINMSALCLPASCCRSQIFLQYFNSHFFWKHLPPLIWRYFGSKSASFQITILTVFSLIFCFYLTIFQSGLSPQVLCVSQRGRGRGGGGGGKRGKEEEEGWHKTQLYHIILAYLDSCLLSTNFAIYTSDGHETS